MGRTESEIEDMERTADAIDLLPDGPERDGRLKGWCVRTLKFGAYLQMCSDRDWEAARIRLGYCAWSVEEQM